MPWLTVVYIYAELNTELLLAHEAVARLQKERDQALVRKGFYFRLPTSFIPGCVAGIRSSGIKG